MSASSGAYILPLTVFLVRANLIVTGMGGVLSDVRCVVPMRVLTCSLVRQVMNIPPVRIYSAERISPHVALMHFDRTRGFSEERLLSPLVSCT